MPDYDVSVRTTDLMGLADVHRWTVIKTNRHQSVAEHSFNVMVIAAELCHWLGIPRERVLWWALIHDVPETLTGDVDGWFKRLNPDVKAAIGRAELKMFPWFREELTGVTATTASVVKIADKIEAIQFIRTWGVGGRANAVMHELRRYLLVDIVDAACTTLNLSHEALEAIVRQVLDHSTTEESTIQERAVAAEPGTRGMDRATGPAAT